MLLNLVSSAAGSAVNHVQKKTSNIAAGYFNSHDSFDVKRFYKALPREELGRARYFKRGTSLIFKIESFTESSLGYFKRGPTAFY
jgi:hypothetical protein